ncbi:MAG: L,D-transpeptidase [Verrucomicrobiota bacterium]|nr:L,D-transpeptidase [Verrucomicrobiota bacterium]
MQTGERNEAETRIGISISDQNLQVLQGNRQIASFVVSTSKFGVGSREGSNKTPLGDFEVGEKIGDGAKLMTVFKGRRPIGIQDLKQASDGDLVMTRILWLHGCEQHNANTRGRYIYIHGTNHEQDLGQPASFGCIRMGNEDVVRLFGMVDVGSKVRIIE